MWHEKYYWEISQIEKFSKLGYERDLVCATGGNVSMRCGDGVLITASGVSLREVSAENIILVDYEGNILHNPHSLKPSKETFFHLGILKVRKAVNCVYHVHPPFVTAYSIRGLDIPRSSSWARNKLGKTPLIPQARSGSLELAKLVESAAADEEVFALILEQHGVVSFDVSMEDSFNRAELMEISAKTAFAAQMIVP